MITETHKVEIVIPEYAQKMGEAVAPALLTGLAVWAAVVLIGSVTGLWLTFKAYRGFKKEEKKWHRK